MKPKTQLSIVGFVLVSLFIISSCDKLETKTTYSYSMPYAMKASELRSIPLVETVPLELSLPGKIYVYNNYLFITESYKGVHIIDNSNPAAPKNIGFITIPGNKDIAVKDDILYADSYVDLVAFDISNITNIKLVKRLPDVFPNIYQDAAKTTFTAYKDTTIITENKEDIVYWSRGLYDDYYARADVLSSSSGQGGSTATFTLLNNYLYTVDQSQLHLFDVNNAADPLSVNTIQLGFGIETIFPHDNRLYIGSNTGMKIFDASTPSAPKLLSTYSHIFSCDPVIVDGKYAYVTLRSGTFCTRGSNLLEVIDIEDASAPKLVRSTPMLNPHGLGIINNTLFVSEGDYGLKTFNKLGAMNGGPELQFIKDIRTRDVIATPKSLIVTGPEGVDQYDYSNPAALVKLSHISVKQIEQ